MLQKPLFFLKMVLVLTIEFFVLYTRKASAFTSIQTKLNIHGRDILRYLFYWEEVSSRGILSDRSVFEVPALLYAITFEESLPLFGFNNNIIFVAFSNR